MIDKMARGAVREMLAAVLGEAPFGAVTEIPELTGTDTLVTVLLSLLGLGAMRTAEKFGGRARWQGSASFALRMPLAPIAIGFQALFDTKVPYWIARPVDLTRLQFRCDAVPVTVNVGSEVRTANAHMRQLLRTNIAGDGFDVAHESRHKSLPIRSSVNSLEK